MITANEIDDSKRFFRLAPDVQIILLEDEDHVNQTFRNILNASSKIIPNEDRSFIIYDIGAVIDQFERIRKLMPRIYPFFAMKCLADRVITSIFGILGAGFDCASWDEIKNASAALTKQVGTFPEKYHPVNTEKIIFSHPFKFSHEMTTASKIGVEFTVFDTIEELNSISLSWPQAKLLIRMLPPKNFKAYSQLGDKFGVGKEEALDLIKTAKLLKLNIVGVSFHVGSGVEDMDSWSTCIEHSVAIFKMLENESYRPYVLDIGGGFPGKSMVDSVKDSERQEIFEGICKNINETLDKCFPVNEGYLIICEPGNYFAYGAGCLFMQILGKVDTEGMEENFDVDGEAYPKVRFSYVVNNSSFHSLEYGLDFDIYSVKDFARKNEIVNLSESADDRLIYSSRFTGFTVDEHDCPLPQKDVTELNVNDWIAAVDKGAYTDVHNDLPTMFCSSTAVPHYYCISNKNLEKLKSIIKSSDYESFMVLNSSNRNSIINSLSNGCQIM